MYRRGYIATVGTAASVALTGCTGGGGDGDTGALETRVSDQPGDISDFETLVVRITEIHPKPTDASRTTLDIDDTEVDLVKLQGEESASIGTADLATGEYEFLQLTVGGVPEAALKDGGEATVTTPGDAPLKFEKSFEIRSGQTTTFVADFTPVKQGRTDRYVLKPVADEVQVRYEGETTTG